MYIKVTDINFLGDQLLSGAITRFEFHDKLAALARHTPESILRDLWRSVTSDPPEKSGKYLIAKLWEDCGVWYFSEVNYSKVHNKWNCFDDSPRDSLENYSYEVDFWMPLPQPPKKQA